MANLIGFGPSAYCELSSNSKVSQLGLTFCVQQDVAGFDVSVDLPHEMKILQTLQSWLEDSGNLFFCELHKRTQAQRTVIRSDVGMWPTRFSAYNTRLQFI